eukprot:6199134-Pleurochrysis_carterae.AAC.2
MATPPSAAAADKFHPPTISYSNLGRTDERADRRARNGSCASRGGRGEIRSGDGHQWPPAATPSPADA